MKSTSSKTEISFISSYPEKDSVHHEKTVGVASYTKNLVLAIEQNYRITVYGEYEAHPSSYEEHTVLVKRSWQRSNPSSWIRTFARVCRESEKVIVIPFEVNMPGGFLSKIVFLAGFLILRLCNKKVITIMHQAVLSTEELAGSSAASALMASGVWLLHRYLLAASTVIVVFEDEFKKAFAQNPKVKVIPHAVELFAKTESPEDAKRRLHLDPSLPVVLYFGYISPYKGALELVKQYEPNGTYRLVLAGGPNPNHLDNKTYMSYVEQTMDLARGKGIPVLGFVKEEDIPLVYAAADLVILPYLNFFSSSGPLSLAFSFGKPFFMTDKLEGYFRSRDFARCLAQLDLTKDAFLFSANGAPLESRIKEALKNREALAAFSARMKTERSWSHVGSLFSQVIETCA